MTISRFYPECNISGPENATVNKCRCRLSRYILQELNSESYTSISIKSALWYSLSIKIPILSWFKCLHEVEIEFYSLPSCQELSRLFNVYDPFLVLPLSKSLNECILIWWIDEAMYINHTSILVQSDNFHKYL